MSASDSRSAVVLELAEEFLERYRQGERPSLKEYIDRNPDLASEIKEVFPALALMENVALADESLSGAATGPAVPGESDSLPPQQLGDYRILREVGRGGMGIVYEAEQVSLGRHVALKVLPHTIFVDDSQRRRFEREAKAAAKLHHTNIVPVFGVGEHDGMPYYVMQFIQGLGLDGVLEELKHLQGARGGETSGELRESRKDVSAADVARSLLTGAFEFGAGGVSSASEPQEADASCSAENSATGKPSDSFTRSSVKLPGSSSTLHGKSRKANYWQSVAQIGMQVAEALEYAHKQGIQHRDIKPSNLLLDTRGTVWVTDFGLARADNEDHLTRTGDIVGTLRYMPPEAFEGRADKRGDIYSLGLTLYELLALKPAFEERDRHRLIKRVTTEEPPRLDKLNRQIPRDLMTIVRKAIDREPRRRYQSAAEMAEDLQRFVDDRPVKARRVSEWERLWRWGHRNPAIASLLIAVVLLLALGSIASTVAAIYLNKAKQAADEAARVADIERQRAVDAGNREAAAREREQERRREAEFNSKAAKEARDEEARQRDRAEDSLYAARLALIDNALRAEDSGLAGQILDKCLPQPEKRDRRGWEWHYLNQWAHAEQASWLLYPESWAVAVALSPDGRTFASAGGGNYYPNPIHPASEEPGEAVVSEFPSGKVRFRLRGHGHLVAALAYSPDGKRLATASLDKTVKLWDINTGKLQATLKGHSAHVHAVSWERDGRRLASGDSDGNIKLWDATTLKETASVKGHRNVTGGPGRSDGVSSLRWDPRGQRLASAGEDGTVKLWDKDLAKLLIIPNNPDDKRSKLMAWSPDGAQVACGNGTQVHIRDATSGKLLNVLVYRSDVFAVAFSPDGMRMASGGDDGVLRIRDSRTGQRILELLGHQGRVVGLDFAGDGRRLLSCGIDGTVKLWDAERDPRGRTISGAASETAALSFTADGTRFRTAFPPYNAPADPSHLRTWDSATSRLLEQSEVFVTAAQAWPRGDFAFSLDAGLLIAPTRDDNKIAALWDASNGKQLVAFRGHSNRVTAAAFAPTADLVATAAENGKRSGWEIKLWNAASGAEVRTFASVPFVIRSLAFSPDGRKLASGGYFNRRDAENLGALTVWETASGKLLRHLGGKVERVLHLAFHPDGVRLAVADFDNGVVQVWNTDTGLQRMELQAEKAVSCVGYSPDGRRLAAMGYDANVRLWDADSGQDLLMLRTFARPPGTLGFTPRFAFSPDGSRIVANSAHGILSLWDAGAYAAANNVK
jgi:WD40 repeat protein/serine/threonine protein kinase